MFGKLFNWIIVRKIKKVFKDINISIGKIKINIPIEVKGLKVDDMDLFNDFVNNKIDKHIESKFGNSFNINIDTKVL